MFSSLYSDFRNSRKAICPAGKTTDNCFIRCIHNPPRKTSNQERTSPLQLRTLSTDSLQVSTSSSGSLGKQHNLPLKRASRSITSLVICQLHSAQHLHTTLPLAAKLGIMQRVSVVSSHVWFRRIKNLCI